MHFFRKHPILCLLFLALLVLFLVLIWGFWENQALVLTPYTIESNRLPDAFSGFKIAQVSDLHNTEFGKDNQKLLALLESAQPNLIAITGDMVDSRNTDPEVAIAFAREAVKIAPTYYVPGNHESRIAEYPLLKEALLELGVAILENENITMQKSSQAITLTGLTDPDFGISWPDLSTDTYQVVLSHRPELLDTYAAYDFDLVLTGHAHGGQIRLPFVGGLIAPHQGFFPTYTNGIHTKSNTHMVISRGLGNSAFPFRLGNRPELILITLESI